MLLPADNNSHLLFQRFELILDINEVFAILSVTRCKVLSQRLGLIKNFPYVLFLCETFEINQIMMKFEESRQTFDTIFIKKKLETSYFQWLGLPSVIIFISALLARAVCRLRDFLLSWGSVCYFRFHHFLRMFDQILYLTWTKCYAKSKL
jgi:hypothetical protein